MGPVTGIDEVLAHTTVLDHGYVKLIEIWGSEERIVEAARMSTGKGFMGWGPNPCDPCGGTGGEADCICPTCKGTGKIAGDENLLTYLYDNKHMSPFEMAGMVIEIQAPIFVFREWHRHRTQSYNEMSARYIPIPDEHYAPDFGMTMARAIQAHSSKNRQANTSAAAPITESAMKEWLHALEGAYLRSEAVYKLGLQLGVPKEIARLPMAVGRYSRMRASANLRNWLGFLTLRDSPHAQWEIQQYARVVSNMVYTHFPRVWALFDKGRTA